MVRLLTLDDGTLLRLEGEPAQGTRHAVRFGTLLPSGEAVVIKLERVPGTLENECRALAWLQRRSGLVPRLVATGTAELGGDRVGCLVTERRSGAAPITAEGWRRMGAALARLAELDPTRAAHGLVTIDARLLARQHARRVEELCGPLAPFVATIEDWERLGGAETVPTGPLVITHGDPGPGNYLDHEAGGTLIDWEQAHVAPLGLDLARLVFIAALGAGPSGYVSRDNDARGRAGAAGYLDTLSIAWNPPLQEARWWLAVAGIQFIHRRWELGGRPGPWQEAAAVLAGSLTPADGPWFARMARG